MNRRIVALAGILAVSGLATWGATRHLAVSEARASDGSGGVMSELAQRNVEIAVWHQALEQDPQSALAMAQLAGLYLQRGRESGDYADYPRAESLARRSLDLRTQRNSKTYVTLAASLLAQHRFAEAHATAAQLVELEPDVPQYRALLGETALELGRYDAARTAFASLAPVRTHLSVAPRLARWLELTGHTDAARRLLRDARDEALARRDLPREQAAWFALRLGDFELRHGRLRAATQALRDGLRLEPNDHRILAALARLEAARGRPDRAIEYGERAIAIVLDPATLGVVGDAYAARGDSAKADEYFRTLEVVAEGEPGPFHRAWALFLLDHGRRTDDVLARARAELETRHDIYGYDLLAWALYRAGRHTEARAAMAQALRLGTEDATLLYHAGMIERALGDGVAARRLLERALAVNPHFHPTQPTAARATLDSLRRERGRS